MHQYPGANGNAETLAAAMNHTYGIQTPPDKIRRTGSVPEAVVSREKTSMPTKIKRGPGGKRQKKTNKKQKANEPHETAEMPEQHADESPDQPLEAANTANIQPSAPDAEQGTAPTASTPVPSTLAGASEPQLAQGQHVDAPAPSDQTEETAAHKATAAKSKPTPPSTQQTVKGEVAGQETQVKKEEDQAKEEEPGTPGPLSAVRERHAETAARENLRRPDTHQQMPSTPATPTPAIPAPGTTEQAAAPSAQTAQPPPQPPSTPAALPGKVVGAQKEASGAPADPDGGGGPPGGPKKRREKTPQEKANHARFMRFTRHIQSPWIAFSCLGRVGSGLQNMI